MKRTSAVISLRIGSSKTQVRTVLRTLSAITVSSASRSTRLRFPSYPTWPPCPTVRARPFNNPGRPFLATFRSYSTRSVPSASVSSNPTLAQRKLIQQYSRKKPQAISKRLWDLVRGIRITYTGLPRVADADSRGMPKAAYYAVAVGQVPGVYTTWAEAEKQVKGYTGARYKKFPTEGEAQNFISSETPGRTASTPSATTTSSSSKPYARPSNEASTSSRSLGAIANGAFTSKTNTNRTSSNPGGTSIGTHTRAESPTTTASSSSLPPNLQKIAEKGYLFTKGPAHHLVVHTDGSALGNGKVGSRAGAGVFWGSYGDAASRNLSERVPGLPQTNNRGELLAVIRALEQCPFPDIPLEVRCDSQYTISCVTTWLPKWLRTNFRTSTSTYSKGGSNNYSQSLAPQASKQVSNVDMIKHLLVLLRRRGTVGRVKFKYVPAHSGVEGNEAADRLAKMGSMSPEVEQRIDWLDPDVDDISVTGTAAGASATASASANTDDGAPTGENGTTDVEVEIDENWLMSPEELASFEDELTEA